MDDSFGSSGNQLRWTPEQMGLRKQVAAIRVPRAEATRIWETIDLIREDRLLEREPTCLLVAGETGVGKTEILKQYLARHPPRRVKGNIVRPFLYVSLPQGSTPRDAAQRMLRMLMDTSKNSRPSLEEERYLRDVSRGSKNEVTGMAIAQMAAQGVEAACFDEFQHTTERGAAKTRLDTTDWIKDLVKTGEISIVMAGMPSITAFVRDHPQLSGLTQYPFTLDNFGYENQNDRSRFSEFLRCFGERLPFARCVPLDDPDIALAVHLSTAGNLRILRRLLNAAGDLAIKQDMDELAVVHLALAAPSVFHLVPEAQRPLGNPFIPLL